MASLLVITSVEKLQKEVNESVKQLASIPGVYISLNKTQKSIETILKGDGINTKKIFFIDCVSTQQTRDDVLNIKPTDLPKLNSAINDFIKEIKGKKFLIIDALSTLLIYNNENKVAQFVQEVTEHASQNDVDVIAFSPETKGEELLNKIFNFFDKVKKK